MSVNPVDPDVYIPPEIDARDAAILNAVYARRLAIECTISGFSARIAPAWADQDELGLERSAICLLIDNAPAELLVNTALIEIVLAGIGHHLNAASPSPSHAGLLMEFVLADTLAGLEHSAGVKLCILSVGDSDRWIADGIALRFALSIDQIGTSWCWLTIPRHLAARLAGLLARSQAPRPVPTSTELLIALRTGHVTVTAAELRSLSVGDILLAEQACAPSAAAAVIAEHLAAPVELAIDGPRLVGAPSLLKRSPLGWSGGELPLAEGPPEGAAESIPIRVFFELGRQSIAATEVSRLTPGSRLPIRLQNGGLVNIVAGDRRIGCGEPVTVGQGGGLRIARLFSHE